MIGELSPIVTPPILIALDFLRAINV
jgi:hypothetical protein